MYNKLCVVLLLSVSLLAGCSQLPKGEAKTPTDGQNKGSVAIKATSFVVDENNSTYYSDPGETWESARMVRKDANGKEITINEWGSPIVLHNDWLFFRDSKDGIYKTKTDGSEKTLISNNAVGGMLLIDDWIYFDYFERTSPHYRHSIARTDANGENFQILCDHDCNRFVGYIDGWLYYARDNYEFRQNKETSTEYSLYRMRADGTDLSLVSDYGTSHAVIDGESIYYLFDSLDEYPKDIYKTDLDGGNLTQLHILPQGEEVYYEMDVKDGWIYYCNGYDGSDLHRVRVDGTSDEVIFEGLVMDLELSGDWLFCFDQGSGYWYKMKPDGTGREQLYPDSMIMTGPGIPEE